MEATDNLQKFGQSYQAKVVASLLENQPFLNQVADITKKDFCDYFQVQILLKNSQSFIFKNFVKVHKCDY